MIEFNELQVDIAALQETATRLWLCLKKKKITRAVQKGAGHFFLENRTT